MRRRGTRLLRLRSLFLSDRCRYERWSVTNVMSAMRGALGPSSFCGMTSTSTRSLSWRVPWLSCQPKKARKTMSRSSDGGSLRDLRSIVAEAMGARSSSWRAQEQWNRGYFSARHITCSHKAVQAVECQASEGGDEGTGGCDISALEPCAAPPSWFMSGQLTRGLGRRASSRVNRRADKQQPVVPTVPDAFGVVLDG